MNAPPPSALLRLLSRTASRQLSPGDLSSSEGYARHRQEHLCRSRLHRRLRRVELSDACSLLFENRATVLSHIEEVRFHEGKSWTTERLEREIDSYRALLPQAGELKATVFVHGGDAGFGTSLARMLAHGEPALGLRVGRSVVAARSVDERWDPLSPVLYVGLRLDAAAEEAIRLGDDDVEVWLSVDGVQRSVTLPAHTRFELERDLWEAASES